MSKKFEGRFQRIEVIDMKRNVETFEINAQRTKQGEKIERSMRRENGEIFEASNE